MKKQECDLFNYKINKNIAVNAGIAELGFRKSDINNNFPYSLLIVSISLLLKIYIMNAKIKNTAVSFKQLIKNMKEEGLRPQSLSEEVLNSVTHGAAAAAAAAGTVILIITASGEKSAGIITGLAIYGTSMIFLYLMSALYHSLSFTKAREVFKLFDHCAIFILIAGSYTPISFAIGGATGWTVFGFVWGLALLGIVLEAVYKSRVKLLSMTIYVLMGWLVVFAWNPMLDNIHNGMIPWLLAGGLSYTGGIILYALSGIKYFHMLWHFAVIAGSVFHYIGILFYIAI